MLSLTVPHNSFNKAVHRWSTGQPWHREWREQQCPAISVITDQHWMLTWICVIINPFWHAVSQNKLGVTIIRHTVPHVKMTWQTNFELFWKIWWEVCNWSQSKKVRKRLYLKTWQITLFKPWKWTTLIFFLSSNPFPGAWAVGPDHRAAGGGLQEEEPHRSAGPPDPHAQREYQHSD